MTNLNSCVQCNICVGQAFLSKGWFMSRMEKGAFRFKRFTICHDRCAMKVGTDGVLLGAWARGGKRILDIGTGSGLVALMMAQRFPDALVTGVEVEPNAFKQACENAKDSPFANRIDIVCGMIQDCFFPWKYDAVVCNPPYFSHSLRNPDKRRAMARHNDLLPFRDLFVSVSRLITDTGKFSMVIPEVVFPDIMKEVLLSGFFLSRKYELRTKVNKQVTRFLLEFSRERVEMPECREELIYIDENVRSEWYSQLTRNFYLTEEELLALKSSHQDKRK